MGLRLSTAMMLVMSLGLVTACGDDDADVAEGGDVVDEETVVVEEPADVVEAPADEGIADGAVSTDEVVVVDEATDAEPDVAIVEEPVEEADDANVLAEAGGGDAIELDTDVESDGEPITGAAGATDAAEPADAGTTVEVAGDDAAVLADPAAEVADVTGEADATEGDAEVVVVETDPEAVDAGTEVATADTGTAAETGLAAGDDAAEGDDGMVTLETNVTVVGEEEDEGGVDAEARVDPAAPEDEQVEETNDVATDGVDSASEAAMLDLDNLVLDDEGVQRLTEYVEASDIDATQKITIVNGIDAARDDPERLEEILEQVRELSAQ